MSDLLIVAILIVFAVLTAGLVLLCQRLLENKP
jgi:hypothetical protein